ncbi:4-aminobutyrate--2-oxoglutarate transaminase [Leptospira bandrabouensis]|uniref:4-aminobutyrate--2-oxoglutarate transaminase n=1 Tax=Leptospira bandrabouensis TaxID=2484903 RepID=UPI001EEA7567|nr:4-aminobutyrate--2-oxoglutarate transaminase [Leptospira bandrabouensis]MCG6153547.1 4-aminobutyrate--2-oxoglutarate transaminase [Leptospira bandrabouensis]MCW7458419.1 4-aminobutyrate--2-oxoglutarate transaminase [Leptospira bandrabouensis]MCW7478834.1 4-aminobutyrate--2-oxoglutarate transaminase [Leptospira bandrabouensis]MCW7486502.1 4-aminobutyrate--2-oxoglutarate transaminase [Leptospira bandrabouensis]
MTGNQKQTNQTLWERRLANVPRGVTTAYPVFAEKAKNAEIWDVEGKRFIDFGGGIGVQNTGHCHPKVLAAIHKQVDQVLHTAFQIMPYEPYIVLAEKLNAKAPIEGSAKTILFSSGAEALENAVKIARAATGRPGIISFLGGFHGRTMMALALTGKVVPYKKGFGPFASDVYHIPFPMEYHGVTEDDSIKALNNLFKADIDPTRVAAIIIEPVQGEGGFYIASPSFLKKLRTICDEHGILLIADEVQSGFARTGKLFAIEHSGIKPDLITTAKSLAAGMPLSAVIGKTSIMDAVEPGGLGGTYAGNPVACAAGIAVMDLIEEEGILEKSVKLGKLLVSELNEIKKTYPHIGEIRGLGAMVAFELVENGDANKPSADLAKKLTAKALENGLVLLSCGVYGNVIRILVPITAEESIVKEGISIITKSLKEI